MGPGLAFMHGEAGVIDGLKGSLKTKVHKINMTKSLKLTLFQSVAHGDLLLLFSDNDLKKEVLLFGVDHGDFRLDLGDFEFGKKGVDNIGVAPRISSGDLRGIDFNFLSGQKSA